MWNIFKKVKTSDQQKSLSSDQNSSVSISLEMSCTQDNSEYNVIDLDQESRISEYRLKYKYWKEETMKMSVVNLNNAHINDIAFNEKLYMPFMYEDLKNGDESVVEMLELLFPDKISYGNNNSIRQARKEWLKILSQQLQLL